MQRKLLVNCLNPSLKIQYSFIQELLAGNYWYGCRLHVQLHKGTKGEDGLKQWMITRESGESCNSPPLALDLQCPISYVKHIRPIRGNSLQSPRNTLLSPGQGYMSSVTRHDFLYDQAGALIGTNPSLSPNTLGNYAQITGQRLYDWERGHSQNHPRQLVMPREFQIARIQSNSNGVPFSSIRAPTLQPAGSRATRASEHPPRERTSYVQGQLSYAQAPVSESRIASLEQPDIAVQPESPSVPQYPIIANGSEEPALSRPRASHRSSSSRDGGRHRDKDETHSKSVD